jgi:hypothetical protein
MAIIPAPIFVIISSAGYFSRKEVFFAVPTSFQRLRIFMQFPAG